MRTALPVARVSQTFTPSPSRYGGSAAGGASGAPSEAKWSSVRIQSTAWIGARLVVPRSDGPTPAPRTTPTTRVPPSHSVFLPPRIGKLLLAVPSTLSS